MRRIYQAHYHTRRFHELRHLFLSHSLGAFSMGLITLLIPAYLLTIGYSFSEVILFHLVLFAAAIPLCALGAWSVPLIGANRAQAVGQLADISFLLALVTLPVFDWPLWAVPLFKSAAKGFYWPAFHANFSKSRSRRRGGKQLGLIQGLVMVVHGIAPGIGGVVASRLGINIVYGLGVGVMMGAIISMLTAPEVVRHRPFRPQLLSWRRIRPDLVANAGLSSNYLVDLLVWPLLIFLIIPSYEGIGLLSTIVVLGSAFVAIYTGRREDVVGERGFLREGTLFSSVTHGFRLLAVSALHVFGINLAAGTGNALLYTAATNRYYKLADQEPRLEYIWAMESAHLVAWVVQLSLLYGLSFVLAPKAALLTMVVIAIPLSFLTRRIR